MKNFTKTKILTLILWIILSFSISTISFADSFNGTSILNSLLSWTNIQTWSLTPVLYRWVRKNTPQYHLLQQSIDAKILLNKKVFIPLQSEFTKDSVTRFVRQFFKVRSDLIGQDPLTEDEQQDILTKVRISLDDKAKLQQKQIQIWIQKDIYNKIKKQWFSGNLLTWSYKDNDDLINKLWDPYSIHLTGIKNTLFEQIINGEVTGIGVMISKKNEPYLQIVSVLSWSPALEAWLLAGDRITKIDNKIVNSEDHIEDLSSQIQGAEGTSVVITIQRWNTISTFTITRKKLSIDPIQVQRISSGIVLVSISTFQTNIYKKFISHLPEILPYNTIIFDLRDNGWWVLDETKSMLDHIVPKDKVIYHTITPSTEYPTISKGTTSELSLYNRKMIFLINHYTASAAEIFAWVSREYDKNATIIGEPSFGKWSIQTVWNEPDGTNFKLTTAHRLLGKSKSSIQGNGIQPDIRISDNILTSQDEVLEYAIKNI